MKVLLPLNVVVVTAERSVCSSWCSEVGVAVSGVELCTGVVGVEEEEELLLKNSMSLCVLKNFWKSTIVLNSLQCVVGTNERPLLNAVRQSSVRFLLERFRTLVTCGSWCLLFFSERLHGFLDVCLEVAIVSVHLDLFGFLCPLKKGHWFGKSCWILTRTHPWWTNR